VKLKTGALVCCALLLGTVISGQTTTPKPSFEVVSIKPSPPNLNMRGGGPRGDRLTLSGASLKMLMNLAYRSGGDAQGNPLDIIGSPDWMESALYDVQAKADCSGGPLSREQMALMVQSMLEDRFKLKVHMETRDLPVYNLVVGKDGSKIKRSEDQTPPLLATAGAQPCGPTPEALRAPALPPPPAPGRGGTFDMSQMPRGAVLMMMSPSSLTVQATAAPVSSLVNLLRQAVGRPVIDKTGLSGLHDISLQFNPEGTTFVRGGLAPPPGPSVAPPPGNQPGGAFTGTAPTPTADLVPSLFSAIQDLGLRLESARGPVEVVVIDSVSKPSEN